MNICATHSILSNAYLDSLVFIFYTEWYKTSYFLRWTLKIRHIFSEKISTITTKNSLKYAITDAYFRWFVAA
jgi:hypothetical protein